MKTAILILLFLVISACHGLTLRRHTLPVGIGKCFHYNKCTRLQVVSSAPHTGQALGVHSLKTKIQETLFVQFSAFVKATILSSPIVKMSLKYWILLPDIFRQILRAMHPADFLIFVVFNLMYKKSLRFGHRIQTWAFRVLNFGSPFEYDKSILGFVEKRSRRFVQLLGFNYLAKLSCKFLVEIGFRIRPDLYTIISRLSHLFYLTNFLDLFKSKFVHLFFPSMTEDRRKNYVFNRSVSVALWVLNFLVACEIVSTYLKIPLSSTLAFGGVGGVALGLSAKDVAANYLGGMLLLFNEPFTPGDMVTFKMGSNEIIGRVERVGWGQTRIRGRDTRPTYIPNSQFVQTAVTNMDRITHRKFEAKIPIRFQDQHLMPDVLAHIRETLRTIPKLDTLSMPYRIHFIGFGQFSLDIEITCYFATKSVDEFLSLQQVANIEILKAINSCGAQLALPTTMFMSGTFGSAAAGLSSYPIQSSPTSSDSAVAAMIPQDSPQSTSMPSAQSVSASLISSAQITQQSPVANPPQPSSSLSILPSTTLFPESASFVKTNTSDIPAIARASQVLLTNAPLYQQKNDPSKIDTSMDALTRKASTALANEKVPSAWQAATSVLPSDIARTVEELNKSRSYSKYNRSNPVVPPSSSATTAANTPGSTKPVHKSTKEYDDMK